MQVVSTIVVGPQPIGLTRVAHNSVEINDRVEVARGPNPLIHHLAVGFAQRAGMIIVRAYIWGDSGADHANAVRVSAFDNLFECCNNPLCARRMFRLRYFASPGQSAEIVHSFKNNQRTHTCLGENVAIEACERVWSEPIGQQMIAADALV